MTGVAVVGGGVIGLTCAWRAAQRGAAVTVVDPTPGAGASHAAAGMLCPVTEVHYGEEPLLALTLGASRLWPEFAAALGAASGIDVGLREEGTLAVAFDDDDLRVLEDLMRFQRSLGLPVERLRPSECRALEPLLSPRVRGGLRVDGDHQVDNRKVIAALLVACEHEGVRFERRSVRSLHDDDLLRSVDRVVLAAGCRSAELDSSLPVRPVKGQILRLRFDPADPPLTRNLRGLASGRSVYLVPREHGELVVGATVEERGFDTSVTAEAVHELLTAAIDLVPGVRELELIETLAGLRPGSPDNAPIIGVSPSDDRVVLATGHFRNGVLLAPLTGDAVAALVVGEPAPPLVQPFGPGRFRSCT